MPDDLARLRWQCRRGMRELDQLLTRFLENGYDMASEREKRAFAALLDLPDPELAGYFLGRLPPENPDLAAIVERILDPDPT